MSRLMFWLTSRLRSPSTSTLFSLGRSTPAIRAMLTLPLLVARVRADDTHHPATPYDLAPLAYRFHARPDFHNSLLYLCPEPVSDPSPAQVVGAQFHLNPVTWQYSDVVHPHLARDVRQHVVPVVQFDPELRVRQRLGYGAFNLYDIFFGQGPPLLG